MVKREKIAFSGKIASGKTTVANHLRDKYGFIQIRSAECLKKLCALMAEHNYCLYKCGFYESAYEAIKKMENLMSFISVSAKLDSEKRSEMRLKVYDLLRRYHHIYDTSQKTDDVRGMLQVVANELLNEIKESIWIDSAIRIMEDKIEMGEGTYFVHDDMRYPFEFKALRNAGFTLIRLDMSPEVQLTRVKYLYPDLDLSKLNHISETAIDDYKFDYRIDSDKPLVEVLAEVNDIVEGRK